MNDNPLIPKSLDLSTRKVATVDLDVFDDELEPVAAELDAVTGGRGRRTTSNS
jgi:hypothetical protein